MYIFMEWFDRRLAADDRNREKEKRGRRAGGASHSKCVGMMFFTTHYCTAVRLRKKRAIDWSPMKQQQQQQWHTRMKTDEHCVNGCCFFFLLSSTFAVGVADAGRPHALYSALSSCNMVAQRASLGGRCVRFATRSCSGYTNNAEISRKTFLFSGK